MTTALNKASASEQQSAPPLIVGIGASAGGLEALQQFFSCMPGNTGLTFIIVQHLSPDYKSLMAEILGKHTNMMVLQAENEMEIEPDTVYLIPPKKNMRLKKGRLFLTDYIHGSINHPIDIFLPLWRKSERNAPWRSSFPEQGRTEPTASNPSKSTAGSFLCKTRKAPSSTVCPAAPSAQDWRMLFCPPASWPRKS